MKQFVPLEPFSRFAHKSPLPSRTCGFPALRSAEKLHSNLRHNLVINGQKCRITYLFLANCERPLWVSSGCGPSYHSNDRCGSVPEQITLDTLGSGEERKAELIYHLISGMFSSQFGHERSLAQSMKAGRDSLHPSVS